MGRMINGVELDGNPLWDQFHDCKLYPIGCSHNHLKDNKMNEAALRNLSEAIQDDLICLLDSQFGEVEYIEEVKNMACQIIVDKIKEQIEKLKAAK